MANNKPKSKISFNKLPLATTYLVSALLLLSSSAQGEDLVQTYQLAIKNDPAWIAKKARFLGDREAVKQAFGGLLPQARLSATYAKQKYRGSTLDFSKAINDADVTECRKFTEAGKALQGGQNLNDIPLSSLRGLFGCTGMLSSLGSVTTTSNTQDYTVKQYGLNVSQPLFRMDRWYQYRQAQKLEKSAQANLAFAQQDLIIRVAEAYFGVLKAQEELRIARSEEKSLQTQLTEIKNRFTLGLLRDTDLFEIQASYDVAQAIRLKAEGELQNLKEVLQVMTRQDNLLINPLPKELPIDPPRPTAIDDWVNFARQKNFQVIAAQFAMDGAKDNRQEKRAGHMPTVDLFLDYGDRNVGGGFTPSSKTQTIGINMNLPLYTGGITSSQEKQARYKLEESKSNLVLARRNAAMETRQYYRRVTTDVATVKANYRAIRSNNSAYRSIREGYESGIRLLSDLLGSQRRVYQARKEYATSRYDYILNSLKLKRAAGILSPEDLNVLNSWLSSAQSINDNNQNSDSNPADAVDIEDMQLDKKPLPVPMRSSRKPAGKQPQSLYEAIKSWRQ